MNLLLEITIKISALVGLALAANVALGGRSAAVRHWVLASALCCAAVTPALIVVAPSWSFRFLSVSSAVPVARTTGGPARLETLPSGRAGSRVEATVRPEPSARRRLADLARRLPVLWLLGAAINVCVLLIGMWRLTRLAAHARDVHDGRWNALAQRLSRLHGLRRAVRLLQSDHPSLLVTWGLFTPKVMLPAEAGTWDEDRIYVVLSHELAHIRRGDWLVLMGGELLRALYWFNPLLWLACARLRRESERACDDAVVNLGVEGREYATQLLELARALGKHRQTWFPAPSIAPRPSSLERRITAMLNNRLNRRPMTRRARIAILAACLTVTLPVAGFAQRTFATLSGSIVDPMNGILPEVTLVLIDTHTKAKLEVRTDGTGHFEFVGLPQGDYLLEARLPGFAILQEKLTLAGQDVQRDITLQIGSLQETVTVIGGNTPGSQWPPDWRLQRRPVPACGGLPAGGIGGNIRTPVRIRNVQPRYPEDAGIEGMVRLNGLIGTDGLFRELRVVGSAHPDLARAAIEAVSQWEFDETLLNCVPVETPMAVTVDFKRER